MKRAYVCSAISLFFSVASIANAQGLKYLRAIEVVITDVLSNDPKESVVTRRFDELTPETIKVELDLGESIEEQTIILHPEGNAPREFRIEQQFETSLTIMDEGPHLDLRDWKHYYSGWRPIRKLEGNRFKTLSVPEGESLRFPSVTPKQIRGAVLKAGGVTWAKLVRNIKGPDDYPSAIGVSRISFRILVKEGAQWKTIKTLDFIVPMGC